MPDHWTASYAERAKRQYQDKKTEEKLLLHRRAVVESKIDSIWENLKESISEDVSAYNATVSDFPELVIELKSEPSKPYLWVINNLPSNSSLHCVLERKAYQLSCQYYFGGTTNQIPANRRILVFEADNANQVMLSTASDGAQMAHVFDNLASVSRALIVPILTGGWRD